MTQGSQVDWFAVARKIVRGENHGLTPSQSDMLIEDSPTEWEREQERLESLLLDRDYYAE